MKFSLFTFLIWICLLIGKNPSKENSCIHASVSASIIRSLNFYSKITPSGMIYREFCRDRVFHNDERRCQDLCVLWSTFIFLHSTLILESPSSNLSWDLEFDDVESSGVELSWVLNNPFPFPCSKRKKKHRNLLTSKRKSRMHRGSTIAYNLQQLYYFAWTVHSKNAL